LDRKKVKNSDDRVAANELKLSLEHQNPQIHITANCYGNIAPGNRDLCYECLLDKQKLLQSTNHRVHLL